MLYYKLIVIFITCVPRTVHTNISQVHYVSYVNSNHRLIHYIIVIIVIIVYFLVTSILIILYFIIIYNSRSP